MGEAGLTVSELFANFVGDLVDGTYTNGSDERMYANQWFDRCWFGMGFGEQSFLQWLITNEAVEDAIDTWNDLQDAKAELQELQIEDESDEEYADECKGEILYFEETLNDLFNGYKRENQKNSSIPVESEMVKVIQWHDAMTELIGTKNIVASASGQELLNNDDNPLNFSITGGIQNV